MKKLFYIVWSWFTRKPLDEFWLARSDEAGRDAEFRKWCCQRFLKAGVNFEN